MNILEKEIEEVIYEAAIEDIGLLHDRGLYLHGDAHRQVNLGGYGIADMITLYFDKFGRCEVQVVEMKKEEIGVNTLLQAIRYARAIQLYMDSVTQVAVFEIILIGKSFSKNTDFVYLPNILQNVRAYTYSISLEKGIEFHEVKNYKLVSSPIPNLEEAMDGGIDWPTIEDDAEKNEGNHNQTLREMAAEHDGGRGSDERPSERLEESFAAETATTEP